MVLEFSISNNILKMKKKKKANHGIELHQGVIRKHTRKNSTLYRPRHETNLRKETSMQSVFYKIYLLIF